MMRPPGNGSTSPRAWPPSRRGARGRGGGGRGGGRVSKPGGVILAPVPCPCGETIRASGAPRPGSLAPRHGADPHPLTLHVDSLIRRLAAGDPAVLGEPPIRAWL